MVVTLNHLWHCPQSESGRDGPPFPCLSGSARRTPNQTHGLNMISEDVADFLVDKNGAGLGIETKDWTKELAKRRMDYQGKMVSKACPVSWLQVAPGLPKKIRLLK